MRFYASEAEPGLPTGEPVDMNRGGGALGSYIGTAPSPLAQRRKRSFQG